MLALRCAATVDRKLSTVFMRLYVLCLNFTEKRHIKTYKSILIHLNASCSVDIIIMSERCGDEREKRSFFVNRIVTYSNV